MKTITTAAIATCATLLAAVTASAAPTYTIDKVTIVGSKTVPTSKLMDAIQEHKGSRVTQEDIVADRDAIMKVLGDARVGGSVKASMASRGSHMEVTFIVDDQGVQTPVVNKVALKLRKESFVGNASIPTEKLAAAAGLNPGDEMTNAKIAAAQKAIVAVYAAAKKPIDVSVSGGVSQTNTGAVDVQWTVVETKGKAKQRDDRSQDAKDEIQ